MTNDNLSCSISKEKAIEEIINCSGKQFDPEVVKYFKNDGRRLLMRFAYT